MKEYDYSTGTIIGRGGIEVFFQSWMVDKPKGIMVISHGLGEHSGRYSNIVNRLKGRGVVIYAPDHRGHGKSSGIRGHVDSFMNYVEDLKVLINIIRDEHVGLPLFLMGHSMGGVIAALFVLKYGDVIDGLILSSPGFIATVEVPWWKEKLVAVLSKYLPKITVPNELNSDYLSHDRTTVRDYAEDPLVHDRVSLKWYIEFTATGKECLSRASEIVVPLLVFHGTEDRIVDFSGSIKFHDGVSSKDKAIRLFQGLYHETMNEVEHEREKVLDVTAKWILARIKKKKAVPAAKAKKTTRQKKKEKK